MPCSSCFACSVVLGGSFDLPSLPLWSGRKINVSSVSWDAHVPPLSHMEWLNNVSLPQKSSSLVLKRSIYLFLFPPEMGERGTCIYFSFPVLKSWVSSPHNTLSLPQSLISMTFWFFTQWRHQGWHHYFPKIFVAAQNQLNHGLLCLEKGQMFFLWTVLCGSECPNVLCDLFTSSSV